MLDLAMPGADGVEIMRRLAEQDCYATIIIVSGLGEKVLNAARTAAVESGLRVAGVLPKPFRISALRHLLSTYSSSATSGTKAVPQRNAISSAEFEQYLTEQRLEVHYQPHIDCHNRQVVGFEALVRIRTAEDELIAPDLFIPLAERNGQIHRLTEQVFNQAISWFADYLGATPYVLALNTSPSILADKHFPQRLTELCHQHRLAPNRIKLEITETSTAENPSMALELLTQLRVRGFLLAIDDFGVGFSSLEQLVR